jgi:tRNA1(Val) A37 N6-methylase TrmN6
MGDAYKCEPLGKFSINISKDHTFGTDAVLLSDFAAKKVPVLKAVDLGTGCGIIPLLLLKNCAVKSVWGVEIQTPAALVARSNIELNGLEDKFQVLNIDLKEVDSQLPKGEFDLVTCNPPYKAAGTGSKNVIEASAIARHEVKCVFADVVLAAKKLLKFGGRLCVCHRPERLADVMCEMRAAGIEPKVFREVVQKPGKKPWLVLVEGKLGGKAGLEILPPLIVEANGELSPEMIKIYGDYKEGHSKKI